MIRKTVVLGVMAGLAASSVYAESSLEKLGYGYDSVTEQPTRMCLSLTSAQDSRAKTMSSLSAATPLSGNISYKNLTQVFGFSDGQSKATRQLFDESGLAEYIQFAKDTDYSHTYIYTVPVRTSNKSYTINYDKPLNPFYERYNTSPEQFVKVCGDSYVKEKEYGGQVVIMLKITHNTKEDNRNFPKNLKIKEFIGDSPAFAQANNRLSDRRFAMGTVDAFQIGGDSSGLEKIINDKGLARSTSCRMDEFGKGNFGCRALLEKLYNYAHGDFVKQMKERRPDGYSQEELIKVSRNDYNEIFPEMPTSNSLISPELKGAREEIAHLLNEQLGLLARADHFIWEYVQHGLDNWGGRTRASVQEQREMIQENVAMLREAGLATYDINTLHNAQNLLATAKENLKEVKTTLLSKF